MSIPLVVIESPYAGTADEVRRNVQFCRAVCRHAVEQGYAPYASHLFYTQMLDDTVPDERAAGIECGLAWSAHADEAWFCLRMGERMSRGMRLALARHTERGTVCRFFRYGEHGERIVEVEAFEGEVAA